nr:tripartite tricarboxylate transporter substrate-binding protein [Bradyrhizobium sp. Ec3.3]
MALAIPTSAAEIYPNRPIRLLHGFAAGGAADALARIVSDALMKRLGQPIVIEAKPGAGGNISAAMVANADPNGYTIGLVTGGHAISGALYKSLAFSPTDSFEMVSTLVYYSFVIAVRSDSPVKTLPELIALAKSKPSEVSFGSTGFGTTQHLAGELLNTSAGTKMLHVPYRGDSAAVTALLGGEVPVIFGTTVLSQVR